MSRRAPGEGSLSKYVTSTGRTRWRAQWWEPVDPADPRRGKRQRSRGGFETRSAARDALLAQLVGLAPTRAAAPRAVGPTFSSYANTWLEGHRCEPTTRLYIRRAVEAVGAYVGDLPLSEVRPTDLAAAYRALEAGKKPRHGTSVATGPLAASTVFRYSGWIVTVFNSAIDEGLLERNPATHKNAGRPRGPRARRAKPFQVWDAEQASGFCSWATATRQPWSDAWEILTRTGLRSGELLALRWSDVDLRTATLTVERALRYNETLAKGERYEYTLPKNGRSRRIALDRATVEVFATRRHELTRGTDTLRLPAGLVFAAVPGRAPTQSSLLSAFSRVQEAFAVAHPGIHLPKLTVHDVRHTHASLLLASGV